MSSASFCPPAARPRRRRKLSTTKSWHGKGAVTSRQAFFKALRHDLAKNPQAAALYGELEAATSELAVLTNRVPTGPERDNLPKTAGRAKRTGRRPASEAGESQRPFAEQRAQQKRTGAELRKALPADTALVDLIEYDHLGWTEKNKDKPIQQRRVAAFVVRRDQPVAWIDLGPSADIDSAVETWRTGYGLGEEIAAGGRDAAAKSLATAGSQSGRRKHRLDLSRRRIGQIPLDCPAGQDAGQVLDRRASDRRDSGSAGAAGTVGQERRRGCRAFAAVGRRR